MIKNIIEYMRKKEYVPLRAWATKMLEINDSENFEKYEHDLLTSISNAENSEIIRILKKEALNPLNTHAKTLLQMFERQQHEFCKIVEFAHQFDDRAYHNLVQGDHILVGQETGEEIALNSLSDLDALIANSDINTFIANGKQVRIKGLNRIDQLNAITDNPEFIEIQFKIQKYNDACTIFDSITPKMLNALSIHKIGTIMYQNALYLTKYEPITFTDVLAEEQRVDVGDVGLVFAVKINDDFSFGHVIVFDQKRGNGRQELMEIIRFKPQMFTDEQSSKNEFEKTPEAFIDKMLLRVEIAVSLISATDGQVSEEEILMSVKRRLHSITDLPPIQQIRELEILLSINNNAEMKETLYEHVRMNYFRHFTELYQNRQYDVIMTHINKIQRLGAMEKDDALTEIMRFFEFLIDKHNGDNSAVMTLLKHLYETIEPPTRHEMLENRYVNLLFDKLTPEILSIELSSIYDALSEHKLPFFNVNTRFYEQLVETYWKMVTLNHETMIHVPKAHEFLEFAENILGMPHTSESSDKIIEIVNHFLSDFLQNSEFLVKLHGYEFEIVLNWITRFNVIVNHDAHYRVIINEICDLMFSHKDFRKHSAVLSTVDKKPHLITEFINTFGEKFKETSVENIDARLMTGILDVLTQIKQILIEKHKISLETVAPFYGTLQKLMRDWYMKGNMPNHSFELQKRFIDDWFQFKKSKYQKHDLHNLLNVKDLLLSCKNGEILKIKPKYSQMMRELTKTPKLVTLFQKKLQKILSIPKGDFSQLLILKELFTLMFAEENVFSAMKGEFLAGLQNKFKYQFKRSVKTNPAHVMRLIRSVCDLSEILTPQLLKSVMRACVTFDEMAPMTHLDELHANVLIVSEMSEYTDDIAIYMAMECLWTELQTLLPQLGQLPHTDVMAEQITRCVYEITRFEMARNTEKTGELFAPMITVCQDTAQSNAVLPQNQLFVGHLLEEFFAEAYTTDLREYLNDMREYVQIYQRIRWKTGYFQSLNTAMVYEREAEKLAKLPARDIYFYHFLRGLLAQYLGNHEEANTHMERASAFEDAPKMFEGISNEGDITNIQMMETLLAHAI